MTGLAPCNEKNAPYETCWQLGNRPRDTLFCGIVAHVMDLGMEITQLIIITLCVGVCVWWRSRAGCRALKIRDNSPLWD